MTSALAAAHALRPTPATAAPSRLVLGRAIQEHLGEHLRTSYEDLCSSQLPDRLTSLLARFERALAVKGGYVDPEFRDGLMAALPNLRAFALSLARHGDRADDLVQDTLLRAWDKRASFQPGTNMNAWLFTILRNSFYSLQRKRTREVEDCDGEHAASLTTIPDQLDSLHVADLLTALARLSPDQREAILLVGAEGLPYEEVAAICGCAVGTIKSRVNRARTRLAELMGYSHGDLAADNVMQAALTINSPKVR
jgi:RNA polymerase sigma-70 factor (ECF subfamily)